MIPPFGLMLCPDPDCEHPGECFGRPEDFGETTEPEECESCRSLEAMDWKQEDKAWICWNCGHAHVEASPLR